MDEILLNLKSAKEGVEGINRAASEMREKREALLQPRSYEKEPGIMAPPALPRPDDRRKLSTADVEMGDDDTDEIAVAESRSATSLPTRGRGPSVSSRGRGRSSRSPAKATSATSRPKRGSESPEKDAQPAQRRPRLSEGVDFEADFDFLQLRMPTEPATYRAVSELDPEWQESLQKWWNFYQTKHEGDFRRWWTGYQDGTKCCGCKVVTRKDSEWPEGKYRCLSCARVKVSRPCLRIIDTTDATGAEARVVEVLPVPGKEGLDMFAYWAMAPET